jgi:hypothetical protein
MRITIDVRIVGQSSLPTLSPTFQTVANQLKALNFAANWRAKRELERGLGA